MIIKQMVETGNTNNNHVIYLLNHHFCEDVH